MKKILSIIIIILCAISIGYAQQDKSPLFKFLHKRGYRFAGTDTSGKNDQWPDTIYYNTIYKSTLLGSPTIPFSFSSIDLSSGNFALNSAIKIGYGYTWFLGDFTFNENDELTIRQSFSFGFDADFDFKHSFITGRPTSSFVVGGFIGLQTFSLFGGYDFLEKTTTLGIVTRIDIYTIFQPSLKPFGKIRELRGHRKEALIVKNNQY